MKVLVYGSPDAGPKIRCLALIVEDGRVMPVYHFGATAAEARTKAKTWWDGEIERLRLKAENIEKRRTKRQGEAS